MKTIRTTKGQCRGKRADGRPCVVQAESEWELVGTDEALRSHVADWYFVDGLPAECIAKGRYRLVTSGEVVTSADPDAP